MLLFVDHVRSPLTLTRLLNVFAVKWYGESEFWLSLSKVLLSVGLILFTFIAMLGGNPKGDRFGFRYWQEPGAFAEYNKTGDLGRWLGFLACLIQASFTIAGPDYVSMAAGESVDPRGNLPRAFNGMFYRLTAFFILGTLCVGILVPSNDQTMADAFKTNAPGAAASPYVIAMDRLGIPVLPHIVNAMILLAAFSAGNSYVYCASRTLFGLALDGKAPRFFTKCTKAGVPIYCVAAVLLIALLAFLQVSNNASVVLNWFISLVGPSASKPQAKSNPQLGHLLPTDQFHRHHIHLHSLAQGQTGTGHPSLIPPVQELRPAVRRVHCHGGNNRHDLCRRLRGLPPRKLGRTYLSIFIHDDWRFPSAVLRMEVPSSHGGSEA
jgi:hypothetical protein